MSREAVWALLSDWRKQEGGTAIVCSHILAEMEEEASDFAIIDRGHLLKSGRVADLACETAAFKIEVRGNTPAGNVPENPTPEKIRAALAAAGIDASVNRAGTGLSSLYKKTVR